MLFHVTMRHDAAHCPGFHPELMPRAVAALESLDQVAARHGVRVRGLYNALPDHIEYLIVEADSPGNVATFISEANPYGEIAEIETKAVVDVDQLLDLAKRAQED